MLENKDIKKIMMSEEDLVLYILKHGKRPQYRIIKEQAYDPDREPGLRHYMKHIFTNIPEEK